jgi:hypothetical protein
MVPRKSPFIGLYSFPPVQTVDATLRWSADPVMEYSLGDGSFWKNAIETND